LRRRPPDTAEPPRLQAADTAPASCTTLTSMYCACTLHSSQDHNHIESVPVGRPPGSGSPTTSATQVNPIGPDTPGAMGAATTGIATLWARRGVGFLAVVLAVLVAQWHRLEPPMQGHFLLALGPLILPLLSPMFHIKLALLPASWDAELQATTATLALVPTHTFDPALAPPAPDYGKEASWHALWHREDTADWCGILAEWGAALIGLLTAGLDHRRAPSPARRCPPAGSCDLPPVLPACLPAIHALPAFQDSDPSPGKNSSPVRPRRSVAHAARLVSLFLHRLFTLVPTAATDPALLPGIPRDMATGRRRPPRIYSTCTQRPCTLGRAGTRSTTHRYPTSSPQKGFCRHRPGSSMHTAGYMLQCTFHLRCRPEPRLYGWSVLCFILKQRAGLDQY